MLPERLYTFEFNFRRDTDDAAGPPLTFRLAPHPSETPGYFVLRALVRTIHDVDGITDVSALCQGDDPAFLSDGKLWIELGVPSTKKLRSAIRKAPRVVVHAHRHADTLLKELQADTHATRWKILEVWEWDARGLNAAAEHLDRRVRWSLLDDGETVHVAEEGQDPAEDPLFSISRRRRWPAEDH